MPSAPKKIGGRPSATGPAARREYESFDWYEAATRTVAANTTFQEVITFSGKVARVDIEISAGPLNLRFRYRGEAPGSAIRLGAIGLHSFHNECEIVEVQDQSGVGGQLVRAIGHHPARGIDVRTDRRGPSRERPFAPEHELATQIVLPE